MRRRYWSLFLIRKPRAAGFRLILVNLPRPLLARPFMLLTCKVRDAVAPISTHKSFFCFAVNQPWTCKQASKQTNKQARGSNFNSASWSCIQNPNFVPKPTSWLQLQNWFSTKPKKTQLLILIFPFFPCCWNSSLESKAWRKLTKENPMWILRSQICKPQDSTRVLWSLLLSLSPMR